MKRLLLLFLEIGLIVALGVWVVRSMTGRNPIHRKDGVEVVVQLPDAQDNAILYRGDDNQYRYAITTRDGSTRDLTADELAAQLHRERVNRSWGQRLLNVSNPFGYVWVGLGLLGQVLFTGRMVVQWLASEKEKRSTVPPIFWWMSLGGSTMLMAYFAWRRDPIGLLGQSFGWFIYMRNLWFIYRAQKPHSNEMMEAEGKEMQGVVLAREGHNIG